MLRKGWLEGKQIFRVDYPAIGLSLLPIEQTIIVVCMNSALDCYTKKGKKIWGVELSAPAVCMVPVLLHHLGQTLVCVALRGGLVQLYLNKVVVDQFNVTGKTHYNDKYLIFNESTMLQTNLNNENCFLL